MLRRINYAEDAEITRKGNTDYLKTDAPTKDGWRAIRTFNAGTGEWRLTALGKRYFADHQLLPEIVIRIPAIFDTHRSGRPNVRHEGWFPYELLDISLREELAEVMMMPGGREDRLQAFRGQVLEKLKSRELNGEIVLHFESDQMVLLDTTRDWEFSSMSTSVQNDGGVDLEAFLNTPMRGLPENSQIYRSDLVHSASFEDRADVNCAAHQLSIYPGICYVKLWEEFGEIF